MGDGGWGNPNPHFLISFPVAALIAQLDYVGRVIRAAKSEVWVFPPSPVPNPPSPLFDLDLDVDTGRKIQLGQRVDRLRTRVEDVDHTLVRLQLELLARLLVDVRGTEDRPSLCLGGKRNGTRHLRPRLLRRSYDVRRRLVDHRVIEGLETDSDSASH